MHLKTENICLKTCVKIHIILFKNLKHVFEWVYQTGPKSFGVSTFKSYFSPNGNALRFFNSAFGLNKKYKGVREQTSHGISKGGKFLFCYTLKVLLASCHEAQSNSLRNFDSLKIKIKNKKNIQNFFLRVYLSSTTKHVFFYIVQMGANSISNLHLPKIKLN